MVDWTARRRPADSILQTTGLTPLVKLNRISTGLATTIYAKVEFMGPSGSVKDRILPFMVEEAERRGELHPGMIIVEGTTGNTGIATAMVGAAKGYRVIIVMPAGMSEERKKVIRAYGGELILTPGGESDVDLVLEKVQAVKEQYRGNVWEVGQFTNMDNVRAHYRTTGPEIWEQTEGNLDALVLAQGTGGTLTGVGRYLRERKPEIKIFAAEPAECAILAGRGWGQHRIEGIGDGFIPETLDISLLDGVVLVSSQEALDMAKRLSREEGLFCGISSGCNVAASLKVARHHPEIHVIVTMLPDGGLRYLSTELGGEEVHLEEAGREVGAMRPEDREKLSKVHLEIIE